jgi:hypothetical protein
MKNAILPLAALMLSACASRPQQAHIELCGSSSLGTWASMPSAPQNAAVLAALADASQRSRVSYSVEQWFSSSAGRYMLCRHDENSCTGEWWQFTSDSAHPAIAKQDAWVCVTKAGPNNSFKPKPLRGSA